MNYLPSNYGNTTYCETKCGKILTNEHILNCKILNNGKNNIELSDFNGSLNVKLKLVFFFEENLKIREQFNWEY